MKDIEEAAKFCRNNPGGCSGCIYENRATNPLQLSCTEIFAKYILSLKKQTTSTIINTLIKEAEQAEAQGGALSADWLKVVGRRLNIYED